MPYHCSLCGRFTKRIRETVGLPLSTGFPPDKPYTAGTVPFAPFACYKHGNFGFVQYKPIPMEV